MKCDCGHEESMHESVGCVVESCGCAYAPGAVPPPKIIDLPKRETLFTIDTRDGGFGTNRHGIATYSTIAKAKQYGLRERWNNREQHAIVVKLDHSDLEPIEMTPDEERAWVERQMLKFAARLEALTSS